MIRALHLAATERQPLQATDEERELVRRMRAGEESAFEMFANHYVPALHRFAASRLRLPGDLVREIVQATICRAIERLDSYRGEAPLMTWLCACCRNEMAMHFRRESRLAEPNAADMVSVPLESPAIDELIIVKETADRVHVALDHLPPRYASALEWKYLEGQSVDAIGRRLGVSTKAAESILTRARNAFRDVYEAMS